MNGEWKDISREYWKDFVVDAEYQAVITESLETAAVFNSFLKYWLAENNRRPQKLFVVLDFEDLEFLITPDAEFYVSVKIGETIKQMIVAARGSDLGFLKTSLIITRN